MKEKVMKNLKPILLTAALLCGILIAAFSGNGTESKSDVPATVSELDAYAAAIEGKLSQMISGMEGAGGAQVMVTFESSFERVYANNARLEENGVLDGEDRGKSSEKQVVLAGKGTTGEQPILLKELCPRAKGVTVICAGAENPEVENKIKEAVSALLGISGMKVCVAKSKGG